jgi:hypothetical protein
MTDQTDKPPCVALKLADSTWECEKCALAWDDGDKRPDCLTLTYGRLAAAATEQAERIEQSQRALTLVNDTPGLRRFRHQGELKRAMELRALVKLVDRVREEKDKGKAA